MSDMNGIAIKNACGIQHDTRVTNGWPLQMSIGNDPKICTTSSTLTALKSTNISATLALLVHHHQIMPMLKQHHSLQRYRS